MYNTVIRIIKVLYILVKMLVDSDVGICIIRVIIRILKLKMEDTCERTYYVKGGIIHVRKRFRFPGEEVISLKGDFLPSNTLQRHFFHLVDRSP